MICATCKLEASQAKDGLCRTCRLIKHRLTPTYPWTPAMDLELTRVYRQSKGRSALSSGMKKLAASFHMPKYIVQNRAQMLGLRYRVQKNWTAEDLKTLREFAGVTSLARLAKRLGRSHSAVKNMLFTLDISGRVTEGYSQNELAHLMGVRHAKVSAWIRCGWLHLSEARVTQASAERFVWEHMGELHIASCDEGWLKNALHSAHVGRKPGQQSNDGIAVALGRTA